MKILNWIYQYFICPFKGHVKETHLTETSVSIRTKRCKHCKQPLGLGTFKMHSFVPPWSTQEKWSEFCNHREQELRDSCK